MRPLGGCGTRREGRAVAIEEEGLEIALGIASFYEYTKNPDAAREGDDGRVSGDFPRAATFLALASIHYHPDTYDYCERLNRAALALIE